MGVRHLTIGELARRTGVAASALRYWESVGLLPAPIRISGQRRYPPSAIGRVGLILLLQDVGMSLRESTDLFAAHANAVDGWRAIAERKITELDEQIAKAQTAQQAITHALACPHEDIASCPNFAAIIAARIAGTSLAEAHPHRSAIDRAEPQVAVVATDRHGEPRSRRDLAES
jgi:DNA-binding transcriptional MerR regulator